MSLGTARDLKVEIVSGTDSADVAESINRKLMELEDADVLAIEFAESAGRDEMDVSAMIIYHLVR